ncbi:MAG: hypothetical protein L0H23_03640 [Luteimonas sp.]|nr:hypothetical protein [Luteimonas sp.]
MTEPASQPPASESASRLPRHTTPTWEVELLISGVAVFAMLQLPGWLDDRFFALLPRFDQNWAQPLKLVYVYLKSAALILAVTFSLHLLLRAQWIALVGMYSVFPDGIRWERLKMGPVQREIETGRYAGRDAAIDRADNRATIVFAIGVTLASTLLLITIVVACVFAFVIGFAMLAGVQVNIGAIFGWCTALVFAPAFIAMLLDRRLAHRMREGGLGRRLLSLVLRFYSRTGIMQRASNPTFSLLSSHGGEHRANLATLCIFLVAAATIMLALYSGNDPRNLGSYSLFPAFSDDSRTLDASHYDDQRNPARDAAVPFIGSVIASQAYVRLVVPYRPERDAGAMRSNCPAAETLQDDARATSLLDCLQRLHAVTLDGKPLASLQYDVGSDPRTDRPALVAMIDVHKLPPGRHELQVARVPDGNDKQEDTGKSWRIPFWR